MIEGRIPPLPALSKAVSAGLRRLNAFFDSLYHSAYNPFYRSGTLAIGLLLVLLGTGFYLLFFYSVSEPYQSVVQLQQQPWLGRWIRSLHRYATDAALIAVVFHVLQLLAQGKTWGPRSLAWVSGVVLFAALFVSAWTGYVMVWDRHGQLLALSGLKLLKSLPIFSGEMARAFSGKAPLPASFFFMNLFLHVALPLGMVFGMWVHTARLARTVWFPVPAIFYWTVAALLVVSLAVPAVLLPEADLLLMVGRIKADWWFLFWVPWLSSFSPGVVLGFWALLLLLMFTIPLWWRPSRKSMPPISQVIVEDCTGCTQCARDCPYEAISMVPHPNGRHLLAEVSPVHCVSCGICSASCDWLAVGPPDRSSREQIERMDRFCREHLEPDGKDIVIIGCTHNDSVPSYLENLATQTASTHFIGLNCCGTLHSTAIEKLLAHCGGLLICGCAARNCMNRDGLNLLSGRLYGRRVPILERGIDRERIALAPHSERELNEIRGELAALRRYVTGEAKQAKEVLPASAKAAWYFKRSIATLALLAIVVVLNQAPLGTPAQNAGLRVVARLPAQLKQECRPLTAEERASLPVHMQAQEVCERASLSYRLEIELDGKPLLQKELTASGDLPAFVGEDIPVSPGLHAVRATAVGRSPAGGVEATYSAQHEAEFKLGEFELIELSETDNNSQIQG